MNNFSVNTLLESHAFVSGAAFLGSSLACCSIGKYMRLEGVAFHLQLKGIAIATAAQTVFRSMILKSYETETERSKKKECLVLRRNKDCNTWKKEALSILSPIALAGLLVKRSDFKSPILMTATIAGGYFLVNKQLSYRIPLAIRRIDFKDALLENSASNRPTTIINGRDVDLQDSEITWLPDELHIEGDLNLKGCIALRAIPERLYLGGNLTLEGCNALTELPRDLDIKGNLTLNGCTNLAALPIGLKVAGNLNLIDCTSLRFLPADMDVKGNINAKGCTSLSTIPERFKTQGDLILEGCTSIRRLPRGLNIGQELDLTKCSNLLAVPEDVVVVGGMRLTACISLKEIPSCINPPRWIHLDECTGITKLHRNQFDGALGIRGCTGIKELPRQLHLNGGLVIGNIDTISMPEELNIGGNLTIENVKEIHLPEGLKVDGNENRQYGNLRLKNIEVCSLPRELQVRGGLYLDNLNITELPEDLKHLSGLDISNCPHLKTLPEDLVVEGSVFIGGGSSELKVLPRGLRVKGDLVIDQKSSVTELSENLHVDGDLKAGNPYSKTPLAKLGEGTHIGGNLDLDSAYGLTSLPERMTVGGDISLYNCVNLRRIPTWMKNLPQRADGKQQIHLGGTRIDPQEIEELKRIYDGRADIHIGYPDVASYDYTPLREINPFRDYKKQLELLEIAHIERPTEEQIRKAFKSLSLRNHPDKGGSTERQQQLEAARNELLRVIESYGL